MNTNEIAEKDDINELVGVGKFIQAINNKKLDEYGMPIAKQNPNKIQSKTQELIQAAQKEKNIPIFAVRSCLKNRPEYIGSFYRFQLLICLYDLTEIICQLDPNKPYYIQYTVFGEVQRVKLKTQGLKYGVDFIPVNKLKLFYFFSQGEEGITQVIDSIGKLQFFCDRQEIANVKLNLKELVSPLVNKKTHTFMVLGSGFKAYFKCMIGIDKSESHIDVSQISLNYHKGVYCPCDKLPEEWIEAIPDVREADNMYQQLLYDAMNEQTGYKGGNSINIVT